MKSKELKVLEEMLTLELEEKKQLLSFLEANDTAIKRLQEKITVQKIKDSCTSKPEIKVSVKNRRIPRGLTMSTL